MSVSTVGKAVGLAAALVVAAAAWTAPDKLSDPTKLTAKAPDTFKAKFETSKGSFVIEVHRDWAPRGADRLFNLVKTGYYDGVKFFRVVPNFVAQWGIHGNPSIAGKWFRATIPDDPVKQSNKRGFVTFTTSGAPNSRAVQLFINLADNSRLDSMGFAPVGQVVDGMDVVDKLNGEYGEGLTKLQGRIVAEGNPFLEKSYPNLDGVKKATVE